MNLGGTYLETKVTKSFINADPWGNQIDFKDRHFPMTPQYSALADVQYRWSVDSGLDALIGTSARYQSHVDTRFYDASVAATVITDPSNDPGNTIDPRIFRIDGYSVIDARVGVGSSDDRWRAALWVRNLTDEYYYGSIDKALDTITASAGMPRTYGVSLGYRF
ncbi:MAG: hypothetical protein ABW110_15285 [Steroidobacteraceae bacterium]